MINLNRLRVFHAAASLSSFTRAAEVMHLTQPGISKHVRQLEDYYGTRLFERRGKKMFLTEAGKTLFEATQEILACVEKAGDRIIDSERSARGTLALGASFSVGLYILPSLLAAFRKQHPAITTTLDILLEKVIEARVLDYTFDIGLVGHEVENAKLAATEFFSDELVAIVPARHTWAARKRRVRLEEFLSESFITTTAGSGTKSVIEDRLRQHGVILTRVLDFGNTEGVKKAVEAGLGVSILSKSVVHGDLSSGRIRMLPLAGTKMTRKFFFVHRKDKYLSGAAKEFLKHISNMHLTGSRRRFPAANLAHGPECFRRK
jgi:DNA-binding transcriptional LysR family regulator